MSTKDYQVIINTNPELITELLQDIEKLLTKIGYVNEQPSRASDFNWYFDDLTLTKCRSYIRDIRDAISK